MFKRIETAHSEGAQPYEIPSPLSDLPQELLEVIFSHLSPADLQVATLVSRKMGVSVIAAANVNEVNSIKRFISTLIDRLPKQRDSLREILEKVSDQKFAGLMLLKQSILGVKERLVRVLAKLDATQIAALSAIPLPHFMEDIFKVAAQERGKQLNQWEAKITVARYPGNPRDKDQALCDAAIGLIGLNAIDRSLEVAREISSDKDWKLKDLSFVLAKAGAYEKAIEVARLISAEKRRDAAFKDISDLLAKAGEFDRAVDFANLISEDSEKAAALCYICSLLAKTGAADKAFDLAKLIPDDKLDQRGCALRNVSVAFAKACENKRAIEVALSIKGIYKDWALRNISEFLANKSDLEGAVDVAALMSEGEPKDEVRVVISKSLAKARELERAIQFAASISKSSRRQDAFMNISEVLINTCEKENPVDYEKITSFRFGEPLLKDCSLYVRAIEPAIEIAKLISDVEAREDAFCVFSKKLAYARAMDKSIEVARWITCEKTRGDALEHISRDLVKAKDVKGAIFFAVSIPDALTRRLMLEKIFLFEIQADRSFESTQIVNSIISEAMEGGAFRDTPDALNRAVYIAMSFPDNDTRGRFLEDISKALTKAGNVDRAIEVAKLIPLEDKRGRVLKEISGALMKAGNVDRAIEVAGLISDKYEGAHAFEDISVALIKTGSFD